MLLRRRRKVANEKADNFAIFGSDSITRLWTQITGSLFLLNVATGQVADRYLALDQGMIMAASPVA